MHKNEEKILGTIDCLDWCISSIKLLIAGYQQKSEIKTQIKIQAIYLEIPVSWISYWQTSSNFVIRNLRIAFLSLRFDAALITFSFSTVYDNHSIKDQSIHNLQQYFPGMVGSDNNFFFFFFSLAYELSHTKCYWIHLKITSKNHCLGKSLRGDEKRGRKIQRSLLNISICIRV